MGYELCQMIARVLGGVIEPGSALSRRGRNSLEQVRQDFAWLEPGKTALRHRLDGTLEWWTFAGAIANGCLAETLRHGGLGVQRFDNFSVTFSESSLSTVSSEVDRIRSGEAIVLLPPVSDNALEGLKFSVCLPDALGRAVVQRRSIDSESVEQVRRAPVVGIA